jgi:hypothetical protein
MNFIFYQNGIKKAGFGKKWWWWAGGRGWVELLCDLWDYIIFAHIFFNFDDDEEVYIGHAGGAGNGFACRSGAQGE